MIYKVAMKCECGSEWDVAMIPHFAGGMYYVDDDDSICPECGKEGVACD